MQQQQQLAQQQQQQQYAAQQLAQQQAAAAQQQAAQQQAAQQQAAQQQAQQQQAQAQAQGPIQGQQTDAVEFNHPIEIVRKLIEDYKQIREWLDSMNYRETVVTSAKHASQFLNSLVSSQPNFNDLIKNIEQQQQQVRLQGQQQQLQQMQQMPSQQERVKSRRVDQQPVAIAAHGNNGDEMMIGMFIFCLIFCFV